MRNPIGFCFLLLSSLPALAAPQFSPRLDIPTPLQRLGGLAIADFNGDGKADLAVTSSLDKQIIVYLNQGNGTFGAPVVTNVVGLEPNTSANPPVVGDFNEDGKQDLIVGTISGSQQNILFTGNGDGTFTQRAALPGSFGFFNAAVLDLNGDSHLDLIAVANRNIYVYLGDGKGAFVQQPQPADPISTSGGIPFDLAAADFNKDGKIDFITEAVNPSYYDGGAAISFYSGDGAGAFSAPSAAIRQEGFSNFSSFATADFDGDGNLDLLCGEPDIAVLLLGMGDGTFRLSDSQPYQPSYSGDSSASPLVAAADINGDGKPDAVFAEDLTNTLGISINDGSGKFSGAAADFSANLDHGTGALRVADLNGDGLPDIVITNYLTEKISIFLSVAPKTDFQVSLNTPSQTVAPGGTASYSFTITPLAGSVESATVTCSGLPAGFTCPAATSPISGQPITLVLTVHTPQSAVAAVKAPAVRTASIVVMGLPFVLLLTLVRRRYRNLPSLLPLVLLSLCASAFSGCGSSKSSVPISSDSTIAFTATTSVTQNTQTITHSVPITLIVH